MSRSAAPRALASGTGAPGRWVFALAVTAAIVLKVVLLCTSQSMADGDEAVEGLMAIHILRDGVHPIYPYGVGYGAGAGLEAHWAAVFFALVGPSSIALKAVGLCIWLLSGGFVRAIATSKWGPSAGRIALVAWGLAPFAAQWSLKVSGGHNVAVALLLAALWLSECRGKRYAAACVLPLAVLAHPVALSMALGLAAALVLGAPARERVGLALVLALTGSAALALLWPDGTADVVWNPVSQGFDWAAIAGAFPHVAAGLFSANLNAQSLPGLFDGVIAGIWATAVLASLVALATAAPGRRDALWLLPIVACLGTLLIVRPEELAARHLLPVLPIFCLLLGRWLASLQPAPALIGLLLLGTSGAAVQLREVASPAIHGAGPHGRGVDRQNVLDVLAELARDDVAHVYSGDAMLQWMLIFESRERVIARWRKPVGRVPRYAREVDQARLDGRPVRLVVVEGRPEPGAPYRFESRPLPGRDWLERVFPPSPAEPES